MFSCWEGVATCVTVQVSDQSNLVMTVLDKLRFINQYTTGLHKLSFDSKNQKSPDVDHCWFLVYYQIRGLTFLWCRLKCGVQGKNPVLSILI